MLQGYDCESRTYSTINKAVSIMAYGDLKSDMTKLTNAFNKLVTLLGKDANKQSSIIDNLERPKALGTTVKQTRSKVTKNDGPLIPYLPALLTITVDDVMSLWLVGNPGVHDSLEVLVCAKDNGHDQGRMLFNSKKNSGTSTQNTCRYIRLIAIAVQLLSQVMTIDQMDQRLKAKNMMSLNRFAKELSSTYKQLGYVNRNEPLTAGMIKNNDSFKLSDLHERVKKILQ
eukprot:g7822.t1